MASGQTSPVLYKLWEQIKLEGNLVFIWKNPTFLKLCTKNLVKTNTGYCTKNIRCKDFIQFIFDLQKQNYFILLIIKSLYVVH